MIMAVIMLGGLLLSATAIAGLLTIYQIRQSNDVINSTKAFFAADSALEWQLNNYRRYGGYYPTSLVFSNGATATSSANPLDDGSIDYISEGFSGDTVRQLETILTQ